MKHIAILLAFLVTLSAPVAAQDVDKGLAAYNAGDYTTALKEWTPLAKAENKGAQNGLGVMYKNGNGVPQNYKETVKWYMLAAEQGDRWAQYDLGNVFRDSIQDNTVAHMWFNIASANGTELGGTNRDTIAKEMTPADISKAQAMAIECMNSDYKKCGY